MALTSSSTDAQVDSAFEDNADYDVAASGGVQKAKDFVHACRILIRRRAGGANSGSEGVDYAENIRSIKEQMTAAQDWLAINDDDKSRGEVVEAGLQYFRGA